MIDNLSQDEKYLIFKALTHSIRSNSGIGFHNSDQGHPAYELGAQGADSAAWGDSPERNCLFQLLTSFDPTYHEDEGPNLSTWQRFCAFAVESHHRAARQP
jgi:hypothetical protein